MSRRSAALAARLEQGAQSLANLAAGLTPAEWTTPLPGDGRTVGVVVHHVAFMYPIEIELAQVLASGKPVTGVTWADMHQITRSMRRTTDRYRRRRPSTARPQQRRRRVRHP